MIGGLAISVGDAPARIVDVSYGGLRFEMHRNLSPPRKARCPNR